MTVIGDARRLPFSDGVAQCVVTSPPYYGLRDYGVTGQIGLEQTPAAYVAEIVATFRDVRRVLRDDGVVWLNIGDSYANPGNKRSGAGEERALSSDKFHGGKAHLEQRRVTGELDGYKSKDLLGIPWRVAFALQDDGWYLRSDCIWHKPNPMPESVTDRPTKAHEYVFLLSKSARYFYDAEAVAEPVMREFWKETVGEPYMTAKDGRKDGGKRQGNGPMNGTRNARTVWTFATQPYSGAHFATMPPNLAERCILAGTSQRGACPKCGAAWVREVERNNPSKDANIGPDERYNGVPGMGGNHQTVKGLHRNGGGVYSSAKTIGWRPACDCNAGEPVPCIVLDPFSGSGTTERVSISLGRRFIGTELNARYVHELRSERTAAVQVRGL